MWIRVKTTDKDSIETESLVTHVALQKEREAAVDKEIFYIKSRQDRLENLEQERKTFVFRTMLGALISSVSSIVFIIIDYLKK